jgi:hypothetical protein
MREYLDIAKRVLREFIEIGFLILLALILIHLLLGASSVGYVTEVADNVAKFATAITAPGLIGIAIILVLVYIIAPRWNEKQSGRPRAR